MSADANRKPPRWRRWGLEIAIFIAAFLAFQAWQLRDTTRGPAPQFAGMQTDGQAFDLAAWRAAHPGQPLLIYFWAEWCPICKTTAGSVENIAAGRPLITVATQSGDGVAVGRLLAERGYRFPTLADSDGAIMKSYRLPGTPGFVIIAPDGHIRFVSVGYTSEIGLRLRLWWAGLGATS